MVHRKLTMKVQMFLRLKIKWMLKHFIHFSNKTRILTYFKMKSDEEEKCYTTCKRSKTERITRSTSISVIARLQASGYELQDGS